MSKKKPVPDSATNAEALEQRTVKLSEIKPYKNNPRNNEDSIDRVAASITKYGYTQPIVVDRNMVVLAGHTRLSALQKINASTGKFSEVRVLVSGLTGSKAKAFRIADNKTSESASWDVPMLVDELRAVAADGEMDAFFNDGEVKRLLDELEKAAATGGTPSADDVEKARKRLSTSYEDKAGAGQDRDARLIRCTCEMCGESFDVQDPRIKY